MKTQGIVAKYQKDAIETVNYIKLNYGFIQFRHDEIFHYFKREKIAPVVLYNLKMANILILKSRGVYTLNANANTLSDNAIASKVKYAVQNINKQKKETRKVGIRQIAIKSSFEIPTQLTEKVAIDLLKSKGYRVLKPVAQYEEV